MGEAPSKFIQLLGVCIDNIMYLSLSFEKWWMTAMEMT